MRSLVYIGVSLLVLCLSNYSFAEKDVSVRAGTMLFWNVVDAKIAGGSINMSKVCPELKRKAVNKMTHKCNSKGYESWGNGSWTTDGCMQDQVSSYTYIKLEATCY